LGQGAALLPEPGVDRGRIAILEPLDNHEEHPGPPRRLMNRSGSRPAETAFDSTKRRRDRPGPRLGSVRRSAAPPKGKIPDQEEEHSPEKQEDPERILLVLEEEDLPRGIAGIPEPHLFRDPFHQVAPTLRMDLDPGSEADGE